ncbi:Gfo/Idh/MocA family protein, partial [Clavibacter michiganensis]|nr:gfo/Idh/MocA family oxidoreductase [Clavibacter michiganensis subsp. michiganensis]
PLFDMGPYYVTTLVHAFGAAETVSAVSSTSRTTRTIGSGPRAGTDFPVEVPTHHAALISFAGGQSAQSTFSFQNALPRMGFVEISGSEGTIVLPDPNTFEGDSQLWRFGQEGPETLTAVGSTYGRGSGVLDLARSIRGGDPVRASGEVAAHVLDVLLAIRDAADSREVVEVASSVAKPTPLAEDWDPAA